MTNKIKLPPIPLAYQAVYEINKDMRAYATQAVIEALAQRDADHLAELRAYELTVAHLREQLALRGEPIARLSVDPYAGVFFHLLVDAPEGTHDLFTHPQASQAQRGEPVAWKWRFADGDLSESPFESRSECERDAVGYDGEAIPLYTHPQTSQVPMTEAAAENLATTSWILNCLLNPWDELNNGDEQSSVLPDMVRLIRAVEAFHNIKETP